jgi:hypothetical protein
MIKSEDKLNKPDPVQRLISLNMSFLLPQYLFGFVSAIEQKIMKKKHLFREPVVLVAKAKIFHLL